MPGNALNEMRGVLGGLVVRRVVPGVIPARAGIRFGAATAASGSVGVANVAVTMTRLSLGTVSISESRVQRAGSTAPRLASVPIGNPVRPGTQPSGTTDAGGRFFVPFTCPDASLALSSGSEYSEADVRVGIVSGAHFSSPRTVRVANFRMVPGGSNVQNALQTVLQPVDSLSEAAWSQITSASPIMSTVSEVQSFIESSMRIAGLISGITVPSDRFVFLKLVVIAL